MTREQALKKLQKAEELRDKAKEVIDSVKEAAPYGSLDDLWWLLMVEYNDAEYALTKSRLFG